MTHPVTVHQCKAMGALHKPLVEELQKKVKSVSVLSGNCNMGDRVQNIPPRCHKLWHEPGKKDLKTEAPAHV